MTTDSDRRFVDLAMKAANERTHRMIEIEALLVRLRRFEELEAAARAVVDNDELIEIVNDGTIYCVECALYQEARYPTHRPECTLGALAVLMLTPPPKPGILPPGAGRRRS